MRYQNTMNKQANLVTCAFFLLQGENTYARKWMTQDVLVELMEKKRLVPSHFFKKSTITRVIGRAIPDIDNIFNEKGIIRMNVQKDGKKVYGFYFRNKLEDCRTYPRGIDNWYKVAHKTLDSLQVSCVPLRTRSRPLSPSSSVVPPSQTCSRPLSPSSSVVTPSKTTPQAPAAKRQKNTHSSNVDRTRFLSRSQNYDNNDSGSRKNSVDERIAEQLEQTGNPAHAGDRFPSRNHNNNSDSILKIYPEQTGFQTGQQQQQPTTQEQQLNQCQILTQQTKWDEPETFKYFLGKRRYAEMKRDRALHTVKIKGHLEIQIIKNSEKHILHLMVGET